MWNFPHENENLFCSCFCMASSSLWVAEQSCFVHHIRILQDVPILVIVGMLAYFCFLEQLLVEKKGTYSFMSLKLPFGILGEIAFDGTGWAYGFQCYSYFFAIFMCFGSSRIHDSCYNGYDKSNLLTYFCSCYKWFCCQIANKVLVFFFHNGSSFFF